MLYFRNVMNKPVKYFFYVKICYIHTYIYISHSTHIFQGHCYNKTVFLNDKYTTMMLFQSELRLKIYVWTW